MGWGGGGGGGEFNREYNGKHTYLCAAMWQVAIKAETVTMRNPNSTTGITHTTAGADIPMADRRIILIRPLHV